MSKEYSPAPAEGSPSVAAPTPPFVDFEASRTLIDAMLAEALHAVRTHLRMEVAFISEFQGGWRLFRHVDARTNPASVCVGNGDPLEDSYCQRIIDGRLPELMQDAAQVAEALTLPVTKALPVGAHLSVPIRFSDGSLYGTFCCFSSQPDETLNHHDLNTLRLFAEFSGRLLEKQAGSRKRYEEKKTRIMSVLQEKTFTMVYQPIINVAQHRVVGYEALARFSGEPVRPRDQWFSEAGEVGLQQQLEVATIEEALKGLEYFPADTYISLNVSPDTILSGAVAAVLAGKPLPRLMLEVTEHVSVNDYTVIAAALAPLRKDGLLLAVDDAGAGYASFRHILKLKPDVIKLDRSLIQNINSDSDCRALAAALIRFAEETGSRVVAEGVETDAELALLRSLKVNKAQGFLLGRPMPMAHYAL